MTEPVTNFTAHWSEGTGIEMSWTEPTDVTNESRYLLYYLKNAYNKSITEYGKQSPIWLPYRVFVPVAYKSTGDQRYSLANPATFYTVPWTDPIISVGKAENSIAFKIVHLDSDLNESDPVYTFALRQAVGVPVGAAHFANNVSLDSFGQFKINPQDSYNEIADSVAMVVGTVVGQRIMVPGYGVPDMPLEIINTNNVAASIHQWEPRANASVSVVYTDDNEAKLNVTISESGVI